MSDTELKVVEDDATKVMADINIEKAKLDAIEVKTETWAHAHVALIWGVVGVLVGGTGVALLVHLFKL
jgi:hypothetical protein